MNLCVLYLGIAVFVLSLSATTAVRSFALRRGILDLPNSRSSHSSPVPRGGGIAIAVAFYFGLAILAMRGIVSLADMFIIFGASGLVATVGLTDDFRHLGARIRLIVHFLSATVTLLAGTAISRIEFPHAILLPGPVGFALTIVGLVWLINLFNFMDGIDGLAATEATTISFFAAICAEVAGLSRSNVILPIIVAASSLGFLPWNISRARIFMGDVGSGFLGLVIGVLVLRATHLVPRMLWVWIVLLGVFVVDSTLTLLRRLLRNAKVSEAHRSHAYQNAARRFRSHKTVTLCVAVINSLWLFPIALFIARGSVDGFLGMLAAYSPLVLLALMLEAGVPDA
jgi:Fuc2NAc and GlcNAc transferase